MEAPRPFAGRRALVTGAARGLGRVIAGHLSEAGASVALVDVQEAPGAAAVSEIRARGGDALWLRADLRKETELRGVVAAAAERFGGLDILVNSARPRLTLGSYGETLAEWDLAIDVLLKAPALLFEAASEHLAGSGCGSMVSLTSTNAEFVSRQPAAYHAAKAGLVQLTRYLAYEFGPRGIRVNAVSPGLVDLSEAGRRPLTADPVNHRAVQHVSPLRRAATGAEIARAVLFLCSEASAYINGQVLVVDGGVSLGDHFRVAQTALSGDGPGGGGR